MLKAFDLKCNRFQWPRDAIGRSWKRQISAGCGSSSTFTNHINDTWLHSGGFHASVHTARYDLIDQPVHDPFVRHEAPEVELQEMAINLEETVQWLRYAAALQVGNWSVRNRTALSGVNRSSRDGELSGGRHLKPFSFSLHKLFTLNPLTTDPILAVISLVVVLRCAVRCITWPIETGGHVGSQGEPLADTVEGEPNTGSCNFSIKKVIEGEIIWRKLLLAKNPFDFEWPEKWKELRF